jgi:hypothetical protein
LSSRPPSRDPQSLVFTHGVRRKPNCHPPARPGEPVRRSFSIPSSTLWNTGLPAFAGDDDGTHVRILATGFARALPIIHAPKRRGRGEDRVRAAPAVSCAWMHIKMRTRAYRFSGNTPAFPAQWVDDLYVLSPATNSSCHRHQRIDDWQKPGRALQISAGLTSATDARTTRFRRTQLSRLRQAASPGMARRTPVLRRLVRRSFSEGGKKRRSSCALSRPLTGQSPPRVRPRARRCRVHRIPPHVNDDRDTPL